jgi:small subunit ribosomal protein S7
MPRRDRPERNEVEPDLKYDNIHVSMFVNRLMRNGKKSTAQGILYDSFDMIEERANRPAIEIFEQALQNTMTYQVPIEVPPYRRITLSMRWLLGAARSRSGRSMSEKLAAELLDASRNQGAAVKRKDDTHRMAEANRAFAHYRF